MKPITGTRDLAVGATIVVALSRFVDGQLAWLMVVLLLLAVGLGALQVLGANSPAGETAGVPIESVIPPALAAVGGAGVLRLFPIGLLLIPAVAAVAWFLDRVAHTEARLARASGPPSNADRTEVLVESLLAAFGAYVGIAALAAGGLGVSSGGIPPPVAGPFERGGLAVADGTVAFLLAYRIAALRSSNARDVAWMATTAAALVTIVAAILRQVAIPGVLGPALLVLVLFLWDALHGAPPSRRRDPRRLAETALLLVLGVVVVVWSVGLRT
jgi:hypothetical protein